MIKENSRQMHTKHEMMMNKTKKADVSQIHWTIWHSPSITEIIGNNYDEVVNLETYQFARNLYRNTLSDPHSLNQSNNDRPKSFPGHLLSPLLKLSIVFLLLYLSFACIFTIHYLGLSPVIFEQVLKNITYEM